MNGKPENMRPGLSMGALPDEGPLKAERYAEVVRRTLLALERLIGETRRLRLALYPSAETLAQEQAEARALVVELERLGTLSKEQAESLVRGLDSSEVAR